MSFLFHTSYVVNTLSLPYLPGLARTRITLKDAGDSKQGYYSKKKGEENERKIGKTSRSIFEAGKEITPSSNGVEFTYSVIS